MINRFVPNPVRPLAVAAVLLLGLGGCGTTSDADEDGRAVVSDTTADSDTASASTTDPAGTTDTSAPAETDTGTDTDSNTGTDSDTGTDTTPPVDELALPTPNGPFAVGVHDFEILDTTYPSDRPEDAAGRRIMVRAWYPTDQPTGEPRRYFEGTEIEAINKPTIDSIRSFLTDPTAFDPLASTRTNSHQDSTVAELEEPMPVIVFSHGGVGYVGQNTALMEELASNGYAAFSVGHPGGASGIVYPDGDVLATDETFLQLTLAELSNTDVERIFNEDLAQRLDGRRERAVDLGLSPLAARWRDDKIAVVDYIEAGRAEGLLGQIIDRADTGRLAYAGMSYGGAAATNAAHVDMRASAAFNLDGTQRLSDLLATDIRVPLLTLTTEPVTAGVPYSNEFFYEDLRTMGDRTDIVRAWVPNVMHAELTDVMFLPAEARASLPTGGQGDGARIHATIAGFALSFFDAHLRGLDNRFPAANFEAFPEVQTVDVSHVQDWAGSR